MQSAMRGDQKFLLVAAVVTTPFVLALAAGLGCVVQFLYVDKVPHLSSTLCNVTACTETPRCCGCGCPSSRDAPRPPRYTVGSVVVVTAVSSSEDSSCGIATCYRVQAQVTFQPRGAPSPLNGTVDDDLGTDPGLCTLSTSPTPGVIQRNATRCYYDNRVTPYDGETLTLAGPGVPQGLGIALIVILGLGLLLALSLLGLFVGLFWSSWYGAYTTPAAAV